MTWLSPPARRGPGACVTGRGTRHGRRIAADMAGGGSGCHPGWAPRVRRHSRTFVRPFIGLDPVRSLRPGSARPGSRCDRDGTPAGLAGPNEVGRGHYHPGEVPISRHAPNGIPASSRRCSHPGSGASPASLTLRDLIGRVAQARFRRTRRLGSPGTALAMARFDGSPTTRS